MWNFSLVDPDNRRPVDYDGRISALEDLDDFEARLAGGPVDFHEAKLKLWLTHRLLGLRGSRPELFQRGDYQRLTAVPARRPYRRLRSNVRRPAEYHDSKPSCSELKPEQEIDWWRDTAVHLPQPITKNQCWPILLPLDLEINVREDRRLAFVLDSSSNSSSASFSRSHLPPVSSSASTGHEILSSVPFLLPSKQ